MILIRKSLVKSVLICYYTPRTSQTRGVTRALIGEGGGRGVYSYIHVLPDEFLLKSVVFKTAPFCKTNLAI